MSEKIERADGAMQELSYVVQLGWERRIFHRKLSGRVSAKVYAQIFNYLFFKFRFSFFSKMLEKLSTELNHLSALYSAKCLENSQLDERVQKLLESNKNQAESK